MNARLRRNALVGLIASAAWCMCGMAYAQENTPKDAVQTAPAIAGTWLLTTDWGCGSTITGSFNQTFNADGTWTSTPYLHAGRWFQVGAIVTWTFVGIPNLVYTANLSGGWMTGIQGYEMAHGSNGCFGGHLAGIPTELGTGNTIADPMLGK
jgi:hypothetical protein